MSPAPRGAAGWYPDPSRRHDRRCADRALSRSSQAGHHDDHDPEQGCQRKRCVPDLHPALVQGRIAAPVQHVHGSSIRKSQPSCRYATVPDAPCPSASAAVPGDGLLRAGQLVETEIRGLVPGCPESRHWPTVDASADHCADVPFCGSGYSPSRPVSLR